MTEHEHQYEREEVLRSRPTSWEDEERWEVAYICQICGEEEE